MNIQNVTVSASKDHVFEDLEVGVSFTSPELYAHGVLVKRCGNKAENEQGVYLDFAPTDIVILFS